jgi:hypothetical protein
MTSVNIDDLLDNCVNGSHYNISLYIFQLIKDKYKYSDKRWYLLDEEENNDGEIKLKNEIKTLIANNFGNRSIYWNNFNNKDKNENDIKVVKLLQIMDKLKNEKFLKDIIKELAQFYE